jgi:hypothetical protein
VQITRRLKDRAARLTWIQIDNSWAGAQLIVRREGTTLAAQLVVFGSGVPVVSCIDAPMTYSSAQGRL